MSPYEAFHTYVFEKEEVSGPRKPRLHHLRAYGCKAYVLIKSKSDAQYRHKRRKLDAKAHIGFLVGYESTNIYRVWIPIKKKVVSVRDVIFDEDTIWDGKPIPYSDDDIKELDEAIVHIEIPESEALEMEDIQLVEDSEVDETTTTITRQADHEDENLDVNPEESEELAKENDEQWAQQQYPTPDSTMLETFMANAIRLPIERPQFDSFGTDSLESEGVAADNQVLDCVFDESTLSPTIEPAILDQLEKQQNDRFHDFNQYRIPSKLQTAFAAGIKVHRRNLPSEPSNYRQLNGHAFEKQFRENMAAHMQEHRKQFKSWKEVSHKEAEGHQVLGCQWVFKYKTDKHGNLQKCKARLVVCGNQQRNHNLPTRATTLAITSLHILLAVTAKFDLETLQLNAVNAFVYANLDKTVFMRMLPGYMQSGKVLKLNKVLYGLRRSPLLWQQKLTNKLKKLGFREILQELCVVQRDGIIGFFYVDNIVFTFKKDRVDEVKKIVESLSQALTIKVVGKLKWFLGLHVICNRTKQTIWLSQKAYIMKICNEFIHTTDTLRLPTTPMEISELYPIENDEIVSDSSRTLYQRKVGSLLFAAIATRPDIAFAVSRLSRFNQRPGPQHHEAANRVFYYLFSTQDYCIRYGGEAQEVSSFICASDASFGDNTLDRKSSQGYIMKLFGGAIAWRANKQDTVTTSSTEAELLAISQTAKEAIYLSRLMKALTLCLPEVLTIECNNKQTIRLLVDESTKLQTKLRHVDIHSHWLRQEVQRQSIKIRWVPTKEMMADGLTKALSVIKHEHFVGMTGIENKKELLASIKRKDNLRDAFQQCEADISKSFGFGIAAP